MTDMYKLRSTKAFCNYITKTLRSITAKRDSAAPNACMILKDNYHLIHRTAGAVLADLKRSGPIPYSEDGFPRTFAYACDFCRMSRYSLEADSLERFLDGVGKNIDLQADEITLFVDMFRCALICAVDSLSSDESRKSEVLSAVDSLRFLQDYSFDDIYEKISRSEAVLREDEYYSLMDKESKNLYRHRLAVLARRRRCTEKDLASELIAKSRASSGQAQRHIGYWLFDRPKGTYYIVLSVAVPLLAAAAAAAASGGVIFGLLCVFPFWEIFRTVFEYILSHALKPYPVPRLDMRRGVPKTLVTYITIMKNKRDVDDILSKMERCSYSNECKGMRYGALIDFVQSSEELTEAERALAEYLRRRVSELNRRRENVFFAAVRRRRLNSDGTYSGRERKRGAVVDFLSAVAAEPSASDEFLFIEGDVGHAAYFTALDSDTVPDIDSVYKLVGVLEHPLCKPVLGPDNRTVVSGYGIACPRMEVSLASAGRNVFTRIISGFGGVEVYGNVSFSVYQDIFGEGIFAGKGVINVDVFNDLAAHAFPPDRVLSHDILESNILRCAYVSDVCFSDNVPKNVISFTERAHRWVRGDIQNAAYLAPHVRTESERIKNPFSAVSKYKLWDNIRRTLTAPAQFLLLLSSVFYGPAALWAALLSVFCGAILSALDVLVRYDLFSPLRYRTHTFSSMAQSLLQCGLNLLFLPYFALMQLDAVIKACFRLVRKKKLLEWTTASDMDEALRGRPAEYFIKMWPQYLGLLMLFRLYTAPLAVIWVLAPLAAYLMSKQKNAGAAVPKFDISAQMRAMWGYFRDFMNEENNYLPPDNYQVQPLGTLARRTSPTNIGLAMLCWLGAYDCGFITDTELEHGLSHTLDTIEKLDKWHGHLYNWYNTSNLKPLNPRYVSSVDNGNYAAALYALRNGLSSLGEKFSLCVARIDLILRSTDFSVLYNRRKHLFHIGYDVEKGEYTPSFYDLYASESRLLSYYCAAFRQVSPKNWRSINRFIVKRRGYLGVKSWTGTMFEYFMPNLLLPVYKGSLSDEMLRFALSEQVRYGGRGPWGISECGIYSFDKSLAYQYKACGVPALALKPDADKDMVISPYSTYLALPFAPEACVRNLKKLRDLDMYGEYGFFEAIDYTPTRTGGNPCIVRSYMAHHLAMSFISCLNYRFDNIMQRRFMSCRMQAFSGLIEEKLPSSAVRYADPPVPRRAKERYNRRGEEFSVLNPEHPTVKSFSNGSFVSLLTDCGNGNLMYADRDVTKFRDGSDACGTFVFYGSERDVMSLTYAPLYDGSTSYRTFFDDGEATFTARRRDIESRMSVSCGVEYNCEVREIAVKNVSSKSRRGQLLIYFEPVMLQRASEAAHPAFASLFLESFYEDGVLFFHRRVRDRDSESMWLAVTVTVPFSFELSRFNVLDRIRGLENISSAFAKEFSNDPRGPVDACAALRADFDLRPREVRFATLYTCAADTKQAALNGIRRLAGKSFDDIKLSRVTLMQSIYNKFDLKKEDVCLFELINSSLYNRVPSPGRPSQYRNSLTVENLWKYGISGDNPIILIKTDETCTDKCAGFMKAFRLLKYNRVACDMVFCFSEGGRYDRPVYNRLSDTARGLGLGEYIGRHCGIIFADVENVDEFSLLASVCMFYADLRRGLNVKVNRRKYSPLRLTQGRAARIKYTFKTGVGGFTEHGFGIDDKNAVLSRPPWCHILCNDSFGTVLSDSSLGYTYAFNSQLNKLTPWQNDPVKDNCGERLFMKRGDKVYDLIRDASALFEPGYARYKVYCGNVSASVGVYVCSERNAKVMHLSVRNPDAEPCVFTFETEVILGQNKPLTAINRTSDNHAVYWSNPLCRFAPGGVCVAFGTDCGVSRRGLVWSVGADSSADTYFVLGYGVNEAEAKKLVAELSDRAVCEKYENEARKYSEHIPCVKVDTGRPEFDLFYNTFLLYQTMSSRLRARTGFYQCSGAFGFRDQLQDSMCISTADPSYLRRQLLRAAARQFEQGDVLHWWHEQLDGKVSGVRTRCSDDLLWLPYAACEYIEKTGDVSVLNEQLPYINAPQLTESESEKYVNAEPSQCVESLYLHCCRAIRKGYATWSHGLILFGSGDWNDGMNKAGATGRGESVWCSMFSIMVNERFARIAAASVSDDAFAEECTQRAAELRTAVESQAWDGKWYLRGFHDDGSKIGSAESDGCKIDVLPQSFAAVAGGFDGARVSQGLDFAKKYLQDEDARLVKLFTPPYNDKGHNPGYIRGYAEGVRENGGQYTHAAIWYAWALFKNGRINEASHILDLINPVTHSLSVNDVRRYRLEPYVVAADIYSNPAHNGMGGWSHYTGSAGWYFKVATETMLGIRRRGGRLYIEPSLPDDIKGYSAEIKIDGTYIRLSVSRIAPSGLTVDGTAADSIPLDGGTHVAEYRYLI